MTKGDQDQMNRKRWMVLAGAMAAVVLGAALGAQSVYADTTAPPTPPDGRGAPPGGGPGMHRLGQVELEAAAGVLGMSADDLSAELKNGTTLADLAAEKGVDIEAVQAAIQAAHKQEMLQRINEAVAGGTMTQEKADWFIVGLEKGYLDGPGFGFGPGIGFGGPQGGPQGGVRPAPDATQQP